MRILLFVLLPLAVVGWILLPGGGDPGAVREPVAVQVVTISNGKAVRLEDHLAPGEWTLFEYGAVW